jgi:Bacterial pullanase-associated domain
LHVWTGAATETVWTDPIRPVDHDVFGIEFRIPLVDGADQLAYIIHRGDTKDPGPDQFLVFASYGHEVWQVQGADPENPYVAPLRS